MIDETTLLERLVPEPDGESPVRHRTAVVDAVNGDGTLDVIMSGALVPDVRQVLGGQLDVGDIAEVLVWRGDMLALGKVGVADEAYLRRLRITATNDASPSSTLHGFQIGPDSGANLAMDSNEIMARNNGATSTLFLQADGGNLTVHSGETNYPFTVATGRVQGTSISSYISFATGWAVTSTGTNNYAYRIGGFLMFCVTAERTGADINVPSSGDISNTNVGTLSAECRGNVNVNVPVTSGGSGRTCTGWYNPSTGLLGLAAVGGSSNIVTGNTIQLGGLVWTGNAD